MVVQNFQVLPDDRLAPGLAGDAADRPTPADPGKLLNSTPPARRCSWQRAALVALAQTEAITPRIVAQPEGLPRHPGAAAAGRCQGCKPATRQAACTPSCASPGRLDSLPGQTPGRRGRLGLRLAWRLRPLRPRVGCVGAFASKDKARLVQGVRLTRWLGDSADRLPEGGAAPGCSDTRARLQSACACFAMDTCAIICRLPGRLPFGPSSPVHNPLPCERAQSCWAGFRFRAGVVSSDGCLVMVSVVAAFGRQPVCHLARGDVSYVPLTPIPHPRVVASGASSLRN